MIIKQRGHLESNNKKETLNYILETQIDSNKVNFYDHCTLQYFNTSQEKYPLFWLHITYSIM